MHSKNEHRVSILGWMLVAGLSFVSVAFGQTTDRAPRSQAVNEAQAAFYHPSVVQTVHLSISEDNLTRLKAALPKRIYVPATFRWNETTIGSVAVRYKGNSSSNPRQKHKRSFLIKFDKFDKQQRFLGLRRVSLDNGVQFGSLFSEPLVTETLRDLGVKTHRCNYAKLFVNDRYMGVYVNVERIDESFLESRFADPSGSLFKIDLGGPAANLSFVGPNPDSYRQAFEIKSDAAEKDLKNLVELIRFINQAPQEGFAKQLRDRWDVESFVKVMAVMVFSGAFDQLTGWNAHNYYLYHDKTRDRWTYLPWDLDVGFAEVAFGQIHVLEDWNAAWPKPGRQPNPLVERFLQDETLLSRYRQVASEVLEKYFQPEPLCARLDAKYALIKEALANDPFPTKRATTPREEDYDDIVASMKQFIKKRYSTARKQLDEPGSRPPPPKNRPDRRRAGQPRPGPASKDAPTKLTVIATRSNEVRLQWEDRADGDVGHIVQRASEETRGEFRNHIGQPGPNVTTAVDSNVKPGTTYRYRVYAIRRTAQGPVGTGLSNVVTVKTPSRD